MLYCFLSVWLCSSIPTAVCVGDSLRHVQRCGVSDIVVLVMMDAVIKGFTLLGYLKFVGVL